MNEPGPVSDGTSGAERPVFISYASADRKEALAVCKAIERRRTKCWISCRDVPPGANYQEAIVRAIRGSRAMVLVFSEAANNSDEIKKELSLASKHRLRVMALRIEDVEPSDAFAYELSTRQWIDAFETWDRSIDFLVQHLKSSEPSGRTAPLTGKPGPRARSWRLRPRAIAATAGATLLVVAGLGAWILHPSHTSPHSVMVRLSGFSGSSADIPPGMPDAIRDEIIAAFNDDGVVGVSTASAPPSGSAPSYALGGTIRSDGNQIKVNVRLANERSGALLWSNMFSYDRSEISRVPRHVAVGAGNMVRCGLFGASTYPKALSDPVLANYLQYCQNSGLLQYEPGKALDSAQRVVAASPDFSWGWSAVAVSAFDNVRGSPTGPRTDDFLRLGSDAAGKALALDERNSEALSFKAGLADPRDMVGQERLLRQALAARPLACGCEHYIYGLLLQNVGRNSDAIIEYRRSIDMMALDPELRQALGEALLLAGRNDEANEHFRAAVDLSEDPAATDQLAILEAPDTGDYAAALKALQNSKLDLPTPQRAALQAGFQAIASRDPAQKARAVQLLNALPTEMKDRSVTAVLGALGAYHEAFQVIADLQRRRWFSSAGWLYLPSMKGALSDPGFPQFAQSLGLMDYWKTTHRKPDVCVSRDRPPFCRMI